MSGGGKWERGREGRKEGREGTEGQSKKVGRQEVAGNRGVE